MDKELYCGCPVTEEHLLLHLEELKHDIKNSDWAQAIHNAGICLEILEEFKKGK